EPNSPSQQLSSIEQLSIETVSYLKLGVCIERRNERGRTMFVKKTILSPSAILLLIAFAIADPTKKESSRENGKEAKRALSAANVITELMNTPESNIPEELVEHAHAIAVIPNIVKGAFGVGGSFGKGIVARRMADHSWGTPAFIDMSGGSFGFQIGVSVTDL